MCERNGTANTYNKYFLMLTYFFLFSTSINEHYNAHKRYIFFNLPSLLLKKTDFEFVTILKNREPNYRSIRVNIQNFKRKREMKLNHTPAIKRRFREIVD